MPCLGNFRRDAFKSLICCLYIDNFLTSLLLVTAKLQKAIKQVFFFRTKKHLLGSSTAFSKNQSSKTEMLVFNAGQKLHALEMAEH